VCLHYLAKRRRYTVRFVLKAFRSSIFEEMRERRSRMSSGSNFSLFHTLRDLSPKTLGLIPRPQYSSRTLSSAMSTLRHPSRMSCKVVFCWSVSSRLGRTSSTSRTTFERLLTLLNRTVGTRRVATGMAHSSEIALNWPGESTNCFRILLASSYTTIRSPMLKPKLIVNSNTTS
jgi:hypothetical protein